MVGKCKIKKTIQNLNNYEEFSVYVNGLPEKGHSVYFFFTGSKKENGRSWCMYCQIAEPIVKAYLEELKKSVIFVFVQVGDPTTWRDRACPFRTDARTKLLVIPTIIKWKGVQRLEGEQCAKRDLLQMMFEEEED
ncbi:thioredoxin domain-containing protein 17-like isoform X1 [Plodia interpunctella]|uniref:thioredoxin domain-containing protein 17-like isoform X1 n=1 Tax=Plodia interpunctella TaxID=58824 RepID=UPI002368B600|nr:thioredoxin domain-containing protein 17-like isoform X1 [Plodia interpunctella]